MTFITRFWRAALLIAVLASVFSFGCGDGSSSGANNEDNQFVTGGGNAVAVRIVGSEASLKFPDTVTGFRVKVYNLNAQLLGQTSQPRTNSVLENQVLTVENVPVGPIEVVTEALGAGNATVSYSTARSTVPVPEGQITVNQNSFLAGPAPSPTPAGSPGATPSPRTSPAASPGSSPSASPGTSPSASPASSPSASPGSSPSASPGSSPSASPGTSPSASPGSSPAASPGSSPAASPSPAPGGSPSPFPSPVAGASPTSSPSSFGSGSFSMQSDQGESIGQNTTWSYQSGRNLTSFSGVVSNSNNGTNNYVSFDIEGKDGSPKSQSGQREFWSADFRAVGNNTLVPGTYTGARRAAFAPADKPGLDVRGEGRGSNTLYGDFTIHEVTFDNVTKRVTRFSADFVQYSGKDSPTGPALRGQIRFSNP